MKFPHSRRWLAVACAACLALPVTAFATNGYFLIGYGAKSRGMGGVGVAYAQDALAAASNPAGMADVDFGTMRIDAGGDLFYPPRAVHLESSTLNSSNDNATGVDSNPTQTMDEISGSNMFLIPNMGGIYRFNRKITMGMAAIGAGLGTRYDQHVPGNPDCHSGNEPTFTGGPNVGAPNTGSYFFNFNCKGTPTVGVMLMQMQMLPSVAYKVTKNQMVGGSLAIAVQSFRAYGLQAFDDSLGFGQVGSKPSNHGNDWSYGSGIRLGYLGKYFDQKVRIGANWTSRVYMTNFEKYKSLFAESGDFDIPSSYAVGISVAATPKINVAFDVQRVEWSSIRSVGNKGPLASSPQTPFPSNCDIDPGPAVDNTPCLLGTNNGFGFGWEDRTIYKLGADYRFNDKLTLRAGLNYMKNPIPNEEILFNLLAPATVEKHITLGASYQVSNNMDLSFSLVHAFKNTVKGPTVFGPFGTGTPVDGSNAAASMYQYAVGMSLGYKL